MLSKADLVLVLTVQEKGSFALAARDLMLTEGRVKHRFYRACQLMRDLLVKMG
jgi:DNA-binding transcriptional LysR family regulator